MKLEFIPLDKLVVSKANMRYGRKAPVIVRPNCAPDGYEIIAGSRRFHAAKIVAEERRAARDGAAEADADMALLPCAILDAGDDAAAVEASLIENLARLDPDQATQSETFTRLVKEGRKVEDIAATFGLPDLAVRRVLALGNLLPAIRDLYRREEIDAATVRHLTMASKSQQKAWLALTDDPDSYVPTGHQLKAWLFGGQSIPARHALFDIEASGLATVADPTCSATTVMSPIPMPSGPRRTLPSRRSALPMSSRAGPTRSSCRRPITSRHGNMRRRASARAGASISTCAPPAR